MKLTKISMMFSVALAVSACSDSNTTVSPQNVAIDTPIALVPDEPTIDTPVVAEPIIETPVVITPIIDTPEIDTPVVVTPIIETPIIDTPEVVIDTPVIDTPIIDTPEIDTPVVVTPEEPIIDTPVIDTPVVVTPEVVIDTTSGIFPPNETDITDNANLYNEDGYLNVDVIRVDLRTVTTPGICVDGDESGCTLADVLLDTDKRDDLTVDIDVHFKSDDFADDGEESNASLRLRGGGSRFAPQKSFRIKLDSKDVLWRGERFLQLNKHPFESSRVRNKMAFDTMKNIPHLPSMRTQFVNLWIDDGNGPVDYGLFTHVERPNDDYLARHGLDEDGNLYQAEDFRFDLDDLADVAVDEDGKALSKDRFESVLDPKEGKDHSALVAMLTALNDPDVSFDEVLDTYFNRNNVKAFIATNLLMRQWDVQQHNFYLYQPSDTERFYFIPWDYDSAMSSWVEPTNSYDRDPLWLRSIFGYASMSSNVFFEQYLAQPDAHSTLTDAVNFIRNNYATDQVLTELSNTLTDAAAPFQTMMPDSEFNTGYNESSSRTRADKIAVNVQAQQDLFYIPMQPKMLEPTATQDQVTFSWSESLSVPGSDVVYDLEVATSPYFGTGDVLFTQLTIPQDYKDTVSVSVDMVNLQSGRLYARLTARALQDPSRFWNVASNRIVIDGGEFRGVIGFNIQ